MKFISQHDSSFQRAHKIGIKKREETFRVVHSMCICAFGMVFQFSTLFTLSVVESILYRQMENRDIFRNMNVT